MSSATNISATEDTIDSVLSRSYRFVVPDYQRQYSWSKDQWQEFWNDLLGVVEEGGTHFLGSIVVVERNTSIDEINEYEVVDGQQRLTTISILLCVIRQYYDNIGRIGDAESLSDAYLFEKDNDFNPHQKIKLNSLDNPQYRRILNGNTPRQSDSKLREATEFFESKVVDLEDEEVDEIRKRMLESLTLVTIECNNQESAFRLFETLNDRGLELSEVDLMKNYLYKQSDSRAEINSEAIKRDWESIIDDIRYDLNDPYRFFVHYFLYQPEPIINTSISQHTLYDNFKDVIDNRIPESDLDLPGYISGMADDVHLYSDIVNAEIGKYDTSSNNRINDLLDELDRLGYTQERTYLMGVFSNLDSATEALRATKLIESFIVRRRFTSSITGSDLNELYAQICAEAFEREDPVSYIKGRLKNHAPSDDEFRAALSNHSFNRSDRTLFFLERLESEYFQPNSSPSTVGEIEHIAPRKSYTAKKYNKWAEYLQVGRDEFNRVKDQLGNLTILEQRLNIQAGDNPFVQKKEKYRQSNFKMSNKVAEEEDWSISRIDQRTRDLSKIATKVWDFNI
jgi:uncharacterized protein with ParB-like and HNH nuclease domain/transcriptional regulator with XRE-family HTH domain